MLFKEITGLEKTKRTLVGSVATHHVAHAQLFRGNAGSANLAMALAYATYVNCEDKGPADSCGRCPSCSKMNKLIHPDFHQVFPVTTTKHVSKDPLSEYFLADWRKFIQKSPYQTLSDWLDCIGSENKQGNISVEESRGILRKLSLKSYEAEYKVLLIWLPEMMNLASANALLKILEEPPAKTLFLLVCRSTDKLLTTVLSRTQGIRIRDFTDAEVRQHLTERQGVTAPRAAQIAHLCEGNLDEALRLSHADRNEDPGFRAHEWFREWMRHCFRNDAVQLVEQTEKFAKLSKESQKNLLHYGLTMFREALVWQHGAEGLVRLEGEALDFVKGFAKVVNPDNAERLYQYFNEAGYHLERNANPKILFLDVSLATARVIKKAGSGQDQ
ncbi:MAG: DNA polymerase III subunit delta [Ferruginibacter sp.]|nr:DNA polymerase III subunit delta [Cytophagales bacterium]